jgi:hypothetical protein
MKKFAFTWVCLSNVSVIMLIMRVYLVEFLCQAAMGWIPALECLLPGAHGAYGHVLLYQAVNATAF